MKILYITTIGITMNFFKNIIRDFIDNGHTVDIMCNEDEEKVPVCFHEWKCRIYHHSCSRSPLTTENIKAIKQIHELITQNHYDIVHCHTPIAAACTRIACRKLRKSGTKVFYTAHGFHFYKGAPLKNWLIYYPVEKLCARWTDVLITINKEDFELAKRRMKAGRVEYVPGVGIDVEKFSSVEVDVKAKRAEIGVPEDAFLLMSVGELSYRKNHELVIKAISQLNTNIHYLIIGSGVLAASLKDLAKKLDISDRIHFLGYRYDVNILIKISDVFIFPSLQEGLPVAVMEAMASGKPVVCSAIRGNVDLIDEFGGILFDPFDVNQVKSAIQKVSDTNIMEMGAYNSEKAKQYDIDIINRRMKEIYEYR